jgi:hypothetical protein
MQKNKICEYCGWKIPPDFIQTISKQNNVVVCENCGTELLTENPKPEPIGGIDTTLSNKDTSRKKKKRPQFNKIYEYIKNSKSPIARVLLDSDFTKLFKDSFIIVMSRVIFSHLKAFELESAIDIRTVELTKDILDKLFKRISPVLTMRIKREYLGKLGIISTKNFEKWIKKLHTKLRLNKKYRQDFIIYLRWLVKEVYIIVSDLWNAPNLPKFERIIRNDLKSFSSNESTLNKKKIQEIYKNFIKLNPQKDCLEIAILPKAWDLIDYYYQENNDQCKLFHKDVAFIRHNYLIRDRKSDEIRLVCKDGCDATLSNEDLSGISKIKKIKLMQADQIKNAGDITIYRIFVRKVFNDGRMEWLPFPGISYTGKTIYTANKRFKDHKKIAFYPTRKKTPFEEFIRDYSGSAQVADRLFKVEVLQIIEFQGDWDLIRSIKDSVLREKAIKEAALKTQDIAKNAEKFWVGFFKGQFSEFGGNIHEGGDFLEGITTTVDLLEADILFRQGYLPYEIATKLGLQGKRENAAKTVRGWIRKNLYSEVFYPNGINNEALRFRDGRRIIFKQILDDLVKSGYKTYEELIELLPGFFDSTKTGSRRYNELKRIMLQTHGGIERLVEKHFPTSDKNYYIRALDIIRTKGRYITSKELCITLGFIEEYGYSLSNIEKNGGRYIRQHIGKSLSTLIDEAVALKTSKYYLSKTIALLERNDVYKLQDLVLDLLADENLGYPESTIKKNAGRLLKRFTGYSFEDIVNFVRLRRLP